MTGTRDAAEHPPRPETPPCAAPKTGREGIVWACGGLAAGYLAIHPLAMLVVQVASPEAALSLAPIRTAFSRAHLPMGLVFGLLGAGGGIVVAHLLRLQAERTRAEARASLERDRLAAVIQLAGAVCHELGQPITALLIRTHLLEERLPPGNEMLQHVREIERGAEAVAALLRKLQDLSRIETKPYLGDLLILDLDLSPEKPSGPRAMPGGPDGPIWGRS